MLSKIIHANTLINDYQINLCHWKSNATLSQALNAETDLDILVQNSHKLKLEKLFNEIGAIQFEAIPQKRYKNIDDWLCIDDKTGKLIHFHTHYALDVGEKLIKSYKLPYAQEILQSRQKHPDHNFWISSPEWELLLLILRSALRIPPLYRVRNRLPSIGQDTMLEFEWLKKRYSKESFQSLLGDKYPENICIRIKETIHSGIKPIDIKSLNYILRPFMQRYRRMSHLNVFVKLVIGRMVIKIKNLLFTFGYPIAMKRVLPKGGVIVAFVGTDGSGKSTIVKNLYNVFRQKIDVMQIYFGHGKSNRSILIMFFKYLSKIIEKVISKLSGKTQSSTIIFSIGRILDKQLNIWRIKQSRIKGLLIICDRYPQYSISRVNDGPFLKEYTNLESSANFIINIIAKWEQKVYLQAEALKPDLVIKLNVDPKIAYMRKNGETDMQTLINKNELLKNIEFKMAKDVIVLENNNDNLINVQNKAISLIWSSIIKSNIK